MRPAILICMLLLSGCTTNVRRGYQFAAEQNTGVLTIGLVAAAESELRINQFKVCLLNRLTGKITSIAMQQFSLTRGDPLVLHDPPGRLAIVELPAAKYKIIGAEVVLVPAGWPFAFTDWCKAHVRSMPIGAGVKISNGRVTYAGRLIVRVTHDKSNQMYRKALVGNPNFLECNQLEPMVQPITGELTFEFADHFNADYELLKERIPGLRVAQVDRQIPKPIQRPLEGGQP